jgi:diguanylate cyclase (GGDEF)-like protein
VLTKVGQVHKLPPDRISNAKLHLTGVISFYDAVDGVMFLQDASGGVYVDTDKPYAVHTGDLVVLDGTAHPGFRTEVALDPAIRVLGHGAKIPAPRFDYRMLASGLADCKMVTIRGKVRAAGIEQHQDVPSPSMHLDVMMRDGEVQVYVGSSSGFDVETLLDSNVQITGVAGGQFDAKSQMRGVTLYAPRPSAIRVLSSPPVRVKQLPLTNIDDVFQTQRVIDRSQRIRVRGVLTYYKPGDWAVLEQEGKSIYVQTRDTNDLAVGDIVDAVGFASDHEYAPSLRLASLKRTGDTGRLKPREIGYADVIGGAYSDNLISTSGILVSEFHDVGSDTLVIDVEGHLVSGHLERKVPVTNFLLGSRLRMTGICRIVAGGPWRTPSSFHIEMRNAADVQLIASPSWWTVQHLLELLAALLTVAIAIAAWAILLGRRVSQQAARINRSMRISRERSRILEMIVSNQSPEVLLTEICDSVMALVPEATCWYKLDPEGEPPANGLGVADDRENHIAYQIELAGPDEQRIGRIFVSDIKSRICPADRQEVYAMLSELALVAVRESLLHEKLVYHSTHDPLTGLPNRRLYESRLESAIEKAAHESGQLAVIYIDINRFKVVNDTFGHKVGDAYLRLIAARLRAQLRSTDTLARIGGDEFLVMTPHAEHVDPAELLLLRLQSCFDQPFLIENECFEGSASFGLARYPEDGITAEELQRCADHAMYAVKRNSAAALAS